MNPNPKSSRLILQSKILKNPKFLNVIISCFFLLSFTNSLVAQSVDNSADWIEQESNPPTQFDPSQTIDFEITNSATELKWGIVTNTIAIGSDGVTRYVVVAKAANTSNISYEGINCAKGELKIYARWTKNQWSPNNNARWIDLTDRARAHHALALARSGLCDGSSAQLKVEDIIQNLKGKKTGRTSYKS